jgi:hypothetical protein
LQCSYKGQKISKGLVTIKWNYPFTLTSTEPL